jgi:hypothetical protein
LGIRRTTHLHSDRTTLVGFDFDGFSWIRARVKVAVARFEEVRRGEQLDESAAEMLQRAYA